jgi:molybdopterin-guanine dinucleotide biosynthesis protein A
MGGEDKPLLDLDGEPLVAHVCARLAPQVGRIVISCNRNLERYARWGDAVVQDATPGAGPLGGILAGLRAADTPWAFVCPGDAPNLCERLVARLVAALDRAPADVVVTHDGERMQPLYELLRADLAPSIEARLAAGLRSVHGFVEAMRHVVVDASDERATFANVNTPDELAALRAISRGRAAPPPRDTGR